MRALIRTRASPLSGISSAENDADDMPGVYVYVIYMRLCNSASHEDATLKLFY